MSAIEAEELAEVQMRKLLELTAAGEDRSPEVAALRKEMRATWDAMTEQSRDRIRKLSVELYAESAGRTS